MKKTPLIPLKPLSPEQLQARRMQGHPHPGLVEDGTTMRALERALERAHQEAGEPVPAVVHQEMFGNDSVIHEVKWQSSLFGSITLKAEESLGLGKPDQLDRFTLVVPVGLSAKTAKIEFDVSYKLEPGVTLHYSMALNKTAMNMTTTDVPRFEVEVEWVDAGGGRQTPRTRTKDCNDPKRDNFDLILTDSEGCFIQLEIFVATRRGQFFLGIQRVYAGQVVRTNTEGAEKTGQSYITVNNGWKVLVVPFLSESAYPKSDYRRVFQGADSILESALARGAYAPLSRCHVARWQPEKRELPTELRAQGWKLGTVKFFNGTTGTGRLFLEDGRDCFVHFKQIEEADGRSAFKRRPFPILTPMKIYAVRCEQGEKGLKATAVRPF